MFHSMIILYDVNCHRYSTIKIVYVCATSDEDVLFSEILLHAYMCVHYLGYCGVNVLILFPVGGMGFGLMSSALAGINMIQLSGGPATAGLFPDRLPEAFFIETGTYVRTTTHH